MRMLDFSSLGTTASTLLGLVVFTLIAVGIRLVFMQRMQRRRERENRQINERLKTLIAAYKTLGGSFTGELEVDPRHLRELRRLAEAWRAAGDPDGPAPDRPKIRPAARAARGSTSMRLYADTIGWPPPLTQPPGQAMTSTNA